MSAIHCSMLTVSVFNFDVSPAYFRPEQGPNSLCHTSITFFVSIITCITKILQIQKQQQSEKVASTSML